MHPGPFFIQSFLVYLTRMESQDFRDFAGYLENNDEDEVILKHCLSEATLREGYVSRRLFS